MTGQTELTPELRDQIAWLISNATSANEDGVVGLRFDGKRMPWSEVVQLYTPALRLP